MKFVSDNLFKAYIYIYINIDVVDIYYYCVLKKECYIFIYNSSDTDLSLWWGNKHIFIVEGTLLNVAQYPYLNYFLWYADANH